MTRKRGFHLFIEFITVYLVATAHGPNGKDIAIGSVCDTNGSIEHTRNAFLWPIAAWKLPFHEVLYTSLDSINVFTLCDGKGKKSPSGINDTLPSSPYSFMPSLA